MSRTATAVCLEQPRQGVERKARADAQRQLVEVVRALAAEARVLALDEPTSSLTEEEAERLRWLADLVRRQTGEELALPQSETEEY